MNIYTLPRALRTTASYFKGSDTSIMLSVLADLTETGRKFFLSEKAWRIMKSMSTAPSLDEGSPVCAVASFPQTMPVIALEVESLNIYIVAVHNNLLLNIAQTHELRQWVTVLARQLDASMAVFTFRELPSISSLPVAAYNLSFPSQLSDFFIESRQPKREFMLMGDSTIGALASLLEEDVIIAQRGFDEALMTQQSPQYITGLLAALQHPNSVYTELPYDVLLVNIDVNPLKGR